MERDQPRGDPPTRMNFHFLIEQLRIELPGEQPAEHAQRTLDAQAEAVYAEQTEGVSAREAVAVATSMAEEAQVEGQIATGHIEQPIEEQSILTRIRPPGNAAG